MAIESQQSHGSAGKPAGPGYETRDANIGSVLKFAATLAAVLIVVSFGMKWVFGYFAKTQSLGPTSAPFEASRPIPPLPRLQVAPQQEIHDYWEGQQGILNSYGWVDRNIGTLRIPIDRAMRLVLQRGLPARAAGAAKAEGSVMPGGSQ
jgi:hypothetical protein